MKKFLSLLLCIVLVLSSMPSIVFAAGQETPVTTVTTPENDPSNLHIEKSAYKGEDGKYYITFEAYATGTSTVTTSGVPIDLVLVLDLSLSMGSYSPMVVSNSKDTSALNPALASSYRYIQGGRNTYGMKYENGQWYYNSGSNYRPSWNLVSADTSRTVRIEIYKIDALKYSVNNLIDAVAANAAENEVDHRISIVTYSSGSSVAANLTSVTTGARSLHTTVNNLSVTGYTYTHLGMESAAGVIDKARDDASKIVVLFTDGEPGSGSFNNSFANGAINAASGMKKKGVTVYTIGAITSASDTVKNFLNYTSSNYPNATSMTDRGSKTEDKYYHMVEDSNALDLVFETIATESTSTAAQADAGSVLADALSEYFKLGDKANTGVWTAAKTATGWAAPVANKDVKASFDGKNVGITGFNYISEENLVVEKQDGWHGNKLIVTFEIQIDETADFEYGTHCYPTNDNASVIKDGNPLVTLEESPTLEVTLNKVTFNAGDNGTIGDGEETVIEYVIDGGNFPAVPSTSPDEHYEFAGWVTPDGTPVKEFPATVDEDMEFIATWLQISTPIVPIEPTAAAYKVNYYLENLDGTYTLAETEMNVGDLNSKVTADVKDFAHYTYNEGKSTAEGTVVMPTVENGQVQILTLDLYYDLDTYTVTYEINGEQYGETETYKYGAPVTVREKYAKEGYTVSDWSITEDFTMPAEDVVIVAKMSVNSYDVTYYVDGEQVFDPETYAYGTQVYVRDRYEKEGFTVSDWDKEDFTMPAGNVDIHAYTTVNSYKVTYYVDGVQYGDSEVYEFGTPVTVQPQYVKEGYTVTAWDKEDFTMPAQDVDIHATTQINSYKVTYYVDGEQVGKVETYNYGTPVTVRDQYVKVGYTVTPWDKTDFNMPAQDVDIHATTTINQYKVTYKVDGEQVGEVETYNYDELVEIRDKFEKEGYTVTDWSVTEDFKMPAEDVVITATTEINSYNVTYYVDGVQVGSVEVYEYNTPVTVREKFEKEGYTVTDWDKEDFTMPAEDVDIHATTTINQYTVTYFVDGEQVGEVETYNYNELVEIRDKFEKEGYTVTDWSITEDFKMPAENVEITARTSVNNYTVTYFVDGVQVGEVEYYDFGDAVTVRDQYVKEGYTVTAWDKEDFTMPAQNVEINATSTINQYTVTYKVDGKQVGEVETYNYDELVEIRDKFEKEGYTVTDWSITEDFKMPAENVEINATTTINQYTVTYKVDGKQVGEVETYNYDELVEIRDKFEKEGYTVTDWSITEDFKMPAENVEITAKTSVNNYTVTYFVDGEQVGEVEYYDFGTPVTVRDQYVKTGYTVTPWDKTDFTMPAQNVEIHATTTVNQYKVTYKVDGEQVGEVEIYDYDELVEIRDKFEKEGYTVTDWSVTEDFKMPAEDVVITATTEINSYNVTYYVDGEQVGTVEVYEYNTPVTVREKFEKEGYTVTDWDKEDFTMPAEDVDIHATTTINQYTVTYKVDGKQVGEVETYNYDELVEIRDKFEKEGYTVTDWSITEDFKMPAENVEINATTTVNQYTVTYKVDGKQVGEVETYNYDELVEIRDKFEKEGYTVTDWSITEDFRMPAENVEINATSTVNQYKVTYYVGDTPVGEVEVYDFGTPVTVREQYVKEGYTVTPWDKTDFTMPAEDVEIHAFAHINSYKVTYYVDGERVGPVEEYLFGTDVVVRDQYVKEGYTVTAWDKEDFTMPAKDVDIHATTSINSYTVTYFVDGEQYGEPETYEFGADVIVRDRYSKKGFTVTDWSITEEFYMPAHNVEIFATSRRNQYIVVYIVDGEQVGDPEVYTYEDIVKIRDKYEKEGHTVTDWSITEDFHMPDSNIEIHASTKINSYDVIYKVDGEVVGKVETYEFGAPVEIREKFVKVGYTVTDWSITENFNMPAEDVEINAASTVNQYTVTYKVDGEVVGEVETYDYGTLVEIREKFEKEGYTVTDWSVTESFVIGAENVEITATSKINTYVVNFDVNGHGDPIDPQTIEHGSTVKEPEAPKAPGYTFGGWYTDKECTKVYDMNTPVTAAITVYAKWTKNPESPKTGDSADLALWFALMGIAATGLVVTGCAKKKEEEEE